MEAKINQNSENIKEKVNENAENVKDIKKMVEGHKKENGRMFEKTRGKEEITTVQRRL